jgi:hypothetical protein
MLSKPYFETCAGWVLLLYIIRIIILTIWQATRSRAIPLTSRPRTTSHIIMHTVWQ